MGKIPADYLINRLITFLLTIWIAATLIWLIPRFSPVDPAEIGLGRMAAGGAFVENSEQILEQLRVVLALPVQESNALVARQVYGAREEVFDARPADLVQFNRV